MSLGSGFACRLRAIQQLDVGHWRVVANPEAALEDTQVPALALTEAWTKLDEKLADCLLVAMRRSSFAFGKVVRISSCLKSEAAMFLNIASR